MNSNTKPEPQPTDGVRVWESVARDLKADKDLQVLIIGGGGWIGKAIIDVLYRAWGQVEFDRRVVVLGSSSRRIEGIGDAVVESLALEDWRSVTPRPALVFHNAFLTRDKVANLPLADYIQKNRDISAHVADIVKTWPITGLVLPSSGAAYNAKGELEMDMEANPYGALKVEDEILFSRLCAEKNVGYIAPRIFGLSGEYINKAEIYALANFIQQAQDGAISIRAKHLVYRSYLYIGDLISLCFAYLKSSGARQETFDTAAEQRLEMSELARLVLETLNKPVVINRTLDTTLPPDNYVGDNKAQMALVRELGGSLVEMREQIQRTAQSLLKDD